MKVSKGDRMRVAVRQFINYFNSDKKLLNDNFSVCLCGLSCSVGDVQFVSILTMNTAIHHFV